MANKVSNGRKEGYARYKAARQWEKNRKRKIAKHIKNNPNDKVAALAIQNISYRRRVPTTRLWRGSRKAIMTLMSLEFGVTK